MNLIRLLGFAFATLACGATLLAAEPTPKEQAAALGKESQAARKEKRFADARALQEKIRALPGRTPDANSHSFMFDAETILEEGGEGATEKALEAYGRAFAVKGLSREAIDARRLAALKRLSRGIPRNPEAATKITDIIVDDPESGSYALYKAHMHRVGEAEKAKDEKALYAEAMAAAKVPGNFNRLDAYYRLAEYEFAKGQGTGPEKPEQMEKYLKLMDQAYEAAVNEMGLSPEVATEVYLFLLVELKFKKEMRQKKEKFKDCLEIVKLQD